MLIAHLAVGLIGFVGAVLYPKDTPVVQATTRQLTERLDKKQKPILAHFYQSEDSSDVKSLAEAVETAANVLNGLVKVYAVEQSSANKRQALKFYVDGNAEVVPEKFHGATELIEWIVPKLQAAVKSRMKKQGLTSKKSKQSASGKVIKLTSDNFDELVLQDSENAWFVKFYAPWCGHCKSLEPTWKELAKEMGDKVKIAEVDATVETELAQKHRIQGYPTLILFPAGKKSSTKSQVYQGSRDLGPLVQFVTKAAGASIKPIQILSQDQFDEACGEKLCVVSVLPHILDSSAAERKKYLKVIKQVMTAEAEYPIKYIWLEGGNNLDWERKLRLEFGWPAAVAISKSKNFYRIHRGGFTFEALQNWVRGLGMGRISGEPLPEDLPKLKTQAKWDGKDAPKEESNEEL